MTLWPDAHLPPAMAVWLTQTCGLPAVPVRDVGLRDAGDRVIFARARAAATVVVLSSVLPAVRRLLAAGEPLVEIGG